MDQKKAALLWKDKAGRFFEEGRTRGREKEECSRKKHTGKDSVPAEDEE